MTLLIILIILAVLVISIWAGERWLSLPPDHPRAWWAP